MENNQILRNILILALIVTLILFTGSKLSAQVDDEELIEISLNITDTPGHIAGEKLYVVIELDQLRIIHNFQSPAFVVISRADGSLQFEKIESCDMPHSVTIHNTGHDYFAAYKIYRPEGGIIATGRLNLRPDNWK